MSDKKPLKEQKPTGTVIIVATLGVVVLATWFGVYFLWASRL